MSSPDAASGDLAVYLAALAARRPALIDLGLVRINAVLERMGCPQDRLPPVFHIAGTNGKGSTLAFVSSILEASGARVHAYTSPHLVRYTERIRLAGVEIEPGALREALDAVDVAAGDEPLSFFETFTAAAIHLFAEVRADYVALEVGLGGRFDATNVIGRPAAAVITPVGLDHQEYLGPTLDRIAHEKAGILKPGAPAVIAPQSPDAMAAIERAINAVGAEPHIAGRQWTSWTENGRLIYQDEDGLSDLAPPRLAGAHQFANAGLAVAAIKAAGLSCDDETLSAGLAAAHWPARLQPVNSGPLYDLLSSPNDPDPELWLDGGHNPHAARVLAVAMGDAEERRSMPLIMIVGMQTNKDTGGFLEQFAGAAHAVVGVAADHHGARSATDIAGIAEGLGMRSAVAMTLPNAMQKARDLSPGPARFLVCGSLYLAGDFLRENAGAGR